MSFDGFLTSDPSNVSELSYVHHLEASDNKHVKTTKVGRKKSLKYLKITYDILKYGTSSIL